VGLISIDEAHCLSSFLPVGGATLHTAKAPAERQASAEESNSLCIMSGFIVLGKCKYIYGGTFGWRVGKLREEDKS
jgi:hypothetical protein